MFKHLFAVKFFCFRTVLGSFWRKYSEFLIIEEYLVLKPVFFSKIFKQSKLFKKPIKDGKLACFCNLAFIFGPFLEGSLPKSWARRDRFGGAVLVGIRPRLSKSIKKCPKIIAVFAQKPKKMLFLFLFSKIPALYCIFGKMWSFCKVWNCRETPIVWPFMLRKCCKFGKTVQFFIRLKMQEKLGFSEGRVYILFG